MSVEIKVPELPESVADAVIASWYKQVGEAIQEDEVLVDLETDKVILWSRSAATTVACRVPMV